MKSKIIASAVLTAGLFLVGCDEHHSEGAHVHGHASLSLSLEKTGELVAELRSPGASLYGFEHEPRDDGERAARKAALEKLRRVETWLVLPAGGNCKWSVKDLDEAQTGEHGGEHNDGHGEKESGHNEVHAVFEAQCSGNPTGGEIRVELARQFPALKELRVTTVSEQGQRVVTLKDGAKSLRF